VRDFELDSKTNARTNAVASASGQPSCGLIIFTLAYLAFSARLVSIRFAPLAFLALVFLLAASFLVAARVASQLDRKSSIDFQFQYRALYAVIGITMLCSLFYR